MARIQRRPVSSFIREFLDTAMPVLRASLPILEAREKTLAEQPKALQEAAAGFLDILQGIDPNQLSLLGLTESDLDDLATACPPSRERKPGEEGTDRADRSDSEDRTNAPSSRKSAPGKRARS
jgi:hypothetical protein